MKVTVVTPYCREPLEVISRARQSVLDQTYPCRHVLVADGFPRQEIDAWDVDHIVLPGPHRDYGNTARAAGGMSALNLGAEAVAYLDADNWYAPEHIESLVDLCSKTGCHVAFSDRQVVLSTGELCMEDDIKSKRRMHVDTSCFFVTDRAAHILPLWGMVDPAISEAGDRLVYQIIRNRQLPIAFTGRKTLFYESRWAIHYLMMGRQPPPDAHQVIWKDVRARYSRRRQAWRLGFFPPKSRADAINP